MNQQQERAYLPRRPMRGSVAAAEEKALCSANTRSALF